MNIKTSIKIILTDEPMWIELSESGVLYLCSNSKTMVNKVWKESVRRVQKENLYECIKVILIQNEYRASTTKDIIDTLKANVYAYTKLSKN